MTFILYLTFLCLIFIISYYFIYYENINNDTLLTIIINLIFFMILPLYYFHFKDNLYSIFFSLALLISSFFLNLKIKELFHKNKILPILYFILTSYIFGYILINTI